MIKLETTEGKIFLADQTMAYYRDHLYPPHALRNGKMNLNHVSRDCLRLSIASAAILRNNGIRTIVVAGSAKWKVNSGFEFEYLYTEQEGLKELIHRVRDLGHVMPEIHCWNVCEYGGLGWIVDVTSIMIPDMVGLSFGERWESSQPKVACPFGLARTVSENDFYSPLLVEPGVYRASRQASALARSLTYKILSDELRPI